MVRASFFSGGMFIAMWGIAFLAIDKVVLTAREETPNPNMRGLFVSRASADRRKVIDPPEWAAFSLMSIGSVTMLYSVALPKPGHS